MKRKLFMKNIYILLLLNFSILYSCSQLETSTPERKIAAYKSCNELALDIIGAKKDDSVDRILRAELLLKRKLTAKEISSINSAHFVGMNELGKDGSPAGLFNYSHRQLARKARILKQAGFSSSEIRSLMEKKIVGVLSEAQIMAALSAEDLAPSMNITIRQSGGLEQYYSLDSPDLVGKKILVNFIMDQYTPGANEPRYPVPQMVLTRDYLDESSQELINNLKIKSMKADNEFNEYGGWIVYTDQGAYSSDLITSNDPYMIANDIAANSFLQAIEMVKGAEGSSAKIRDIEFYHSHLERGEAFSAGDLEFVSKNTPKMLKLLESGGTFAMYAIPYKGQVLFKNSVKKK